jgi:hypothetical protein
LKVLVSFSRVKSDQRAFPPPLHAFFSPNASDQNFVTVFLFKIVQRSDNKYFEVNTTPQSWGRRDVS